MKKSRKNTVFLLKTLASSTIFILPTILISCTKTEDTPKPPAKDPETPSDPTKPGAGTGASDNTTQPPATFFGPQNQKLPITAEKLKQVPVSLAELNGNSDYSRFTTNDIGEDFSQIIVKPQNQQDDSAVNIEVINKKYIDNNPSVSAEQGKIILTIKISDKENPSNSVERDVEISGFRPYRDSVINLGWAEKLTPDQSTYYSKDNYGRFEADSEKYLNLLKPQLASIEKKNPFDLASWRSDITRTEADKEKYNQTAKQLKLDTYNDALIKGFTMPVYEGGQVKGLKLYDPAEIPKGPAWWDVISRNENQVNGLARYIPNQKYKDIALQTYSVKFGRPAKFEELNSPEEQRAYFQNLENKNNKDYKPTESTARGTMWILDYEQPTDSSQQPTKWYFGTNNHVVEEYKHNATQVSLTVLKPEIGIRTKLRTTFRADRPDSQYLTFSFTKNDLKNPNEVQNNTQKADYISPDNYGIPGIRIVYRATDFLKTKPTDYLVDKDKNNPLYKDTEEYLDFAVLEIDFSKFKVPEKFNNNVNEFIKTLTNDYYHKQNQHIKFLKKSYLTDYSKIDAKLSSADTKTTPQDQIFIVGYPQSTGDFFLKQYEDQDDFDNKKLGYSLWMNSDASFYNSLSNDEGNPNSNNERANRGNYLSLNIGYRSFGDKPGLTDAFIAVPKIGKSLHTSTIMSNPTVSKQVKFKIEEPQADGTKREVEKESTVEDDNTKKYIATGLEYIPRHYAPVGGASGSSVRNQNNELIGVFFSANETAKTGLVAAFRSEGFDYKGLYGNYNSPQYDLIYGGGADQKTSYREALKVLYGDSFKTALFPSGVKDVPQDFKFTNTTNKS